MTTYTPSQLPSIEWKPCTVCDGRGTYKHGQSKNHSSGSICNNCLGHKKEPVEMENPVIKKECGFHYKDHYHDYKYQVGVEFSLMYCIEDCGLIDESHTAYCSKHHRSLHTISKFPPLRPKVEGDNSVLMVVPR